MAMSGSGPVSSPFSGGYTGGSIFDSLPNFSGASSNYAANTGLGQQVISPSDFTRTPWSNSVSQYGLQDYTSPIPFGGGSASSGGASAPADSFSGVSANDPVSSLLRWFGNTNVGHWIQKEGAASMNGLGTYINDMKNGGLGASMAMMSGDMQKAMNLDQNNVIKDPMQSYLDAYNNPSVAASAPTGRQNFDNAILGGRDIPFLSALGGFATSFIDPLSLAPVGKVAEAVATPFKGAIGALKGGAETAAHVAEPVAEATTHAPMDENFASLADTYTPNDFNMHDATAPQMAKPNPMESQGNVFENQMGQGLDEHFAGQQEAMNPHDQPLSDLNAEIANLQSEHDSLAKSLADSANSANGEGIQQLLQDAQVRRPLPNEPYYNEFKALDPAIQKLFVAGNADKGAVGGFSLPKALASSAPRYKGNPLTFNNELDKALYIVGNTNKVSKNDGAFMNLLKSYTGMGDNQIRAAGQDVRGQIGNYVNGAKPGEKVPLPPLYKDSQAGGTVISSGKGGVSLDEFANGQGKSVADVLDALNNSKGGYTAADFADHPALQDHQYALQLLQKARDAVQAEHDGWAQTAATSAPDHFSLGHDENFGNLLNHIGGAPIGEEPTLAKEAAGGAKTAPFTPTPQPQRNPFVQSFKTMFDRGHGLSDAEKQAFVDANAHNSLLSYSAQKAFDDLRAQFPQLTKEDLNNIGHMIEGTMPMDPRLEPFVNAYHALQEHGIESGGVKYGADAARNTIGWTGQPVLRATRDNYFGHIYKESQQKIQQIAQKAGRMLRNGGSFNKQRTFETLRDAIDAGAHPHLNPLSVGAAHMIDMGRSINDVHLVNKLMDLGSVRRLIPKANAAEATSEQLSMFDHGLKQAGHTIDHIPQGWMESEALPGFVTRPDMERMLRDHLGMDDQTGPIWNLLRGGTNAVKKYSMLLPTVHGRNVLGNAYLAGLNTKDLIRTATRLRNGTYDDIVERALASGAINQESTGGRLIDQLNHHFAPNDTMAQKAMSGVRYLSHGALWDMDRFLRTSLFEKYTKQGMGDAAAARLVNKNMVDYNNLTPFERKYVSTIIPFYSWKKGNLPLQVSHWINNTPRQVAYVHANNAIQNSINGQNTGDDGKLDFGTLADGSHVKFDNYFPGEDPLKIMNDGLLPYAFSSLNPYLKEGINQILNHAYYPGTALAPNGKESMVKTQIRPDGAPLGENIKSTIASVANQFIPSSGVIGSATAALMGSKDGRGLVNSGINNVLGGAQQTNSNPASPMTLGEILGKATGGFTSRDNPAMDNYYQQKQDQATHKAQDTWKKAHGQSVSKQDWAYDNKKIPYPVVTSPLGN